MMTKEERKAHIKSFYCEAFYGKLDALVDEIYADIEGRTCDMCVNHYNLPEGVVDETKTGYCIDIAKFTKVGFCCNRFEQKES